MGDRQHWDDIYGHKGESQLSWHQDDPAISLDLMRLAGVTAGSSVIDIGGGTSRIVDRLIASGLTDITVLDLSAVALAAARERLAPSGDKVTWIAADITRWQPHRSYDLWHDRAVFHFLVDPQDLASYLACLSGALQPGSHALIATFAPDGPQMCSGLPVQRYSPETLAQTLGAAFDLIAHREQAHLTPWGKPQSFQYSLFRRTAPDS